LYRSYNVTPHLHDLEITDFFIITKFTNNDLRHTLNQKEQYS